MEDLAGEVDRAERSCDALEKQARLKLAERDETARRKTMKDGEIAKLEADARMRESVQEQLEEVRAYGADVQVITTRTRLAEWGARS
eukprot:scaffold123105_cov30-Tisochrysis_lutea.AAC.11